MGSLRRRSGQALGTSSLRVGVEGGRSKGEVAGAEDGVVRGGGLRRAASGQLRRGYPEISDEGSARRGWGSLRRLIDLCLGSRSLAIVATAEGAGGPSETNDELGESWVVGSDQCPRRLLPGQ